MNSDSQADIKLIFNHILDTEYCSMHEYFIDSAERNSVVIAPRGHGKTMLICIAIPIYLALTSNFKYFLIIQATQDKTIKNMRAIKHELENNDVINYYCPNILRGKQTEKYFELSNGVIFQGASLGSSLRGLNVNGKRPDYIILDDLYNDKNKKNNELIQEVSDWFNTTVYSLPSNPNKAVFKIIGTKFHHRDIFSEYENKEGFEYRKYSAIVDDKPLWKAKYSMNDLLKIKSTVGTPIFNQEYMGKPMSELNQILSRKDIHFTDEVPKGDFVCAIDPAVTEKASGDYTGIVWGYMSDNGPIVITGYRNLRLNTRSLYSLVKSLHKEYNFDIIIVEAVAGFKGVAQQLADTFPIREVTPKGQDKHSRLANRVVEFENKRVKFYKGVCFEEVIDQLTEFPNCKHDDLMDACLYLIDHAREFVRLSEEDDYNIDNEFLS